VALLYFIYVAVFGSRIDNPRVSTVFVTFLCFIMPVMIFTREEKFKGMALACSLPATRKQIILARYILGWLLMLVFFALATIAIIAVPGSKLGPEDLLNARTVMFALVLMALYFAILMPLLVRFGMVGFFVFLISLQVLGFVTLALASQSALKLNIRSSIAAIKNAFISLSANLGAPAYYALLIAVMVALNLASCACSVSIFKRKDF
jgi:ABC-2 type transport system permease protein